MQDEPNPPPGFAPLFRTSPFLETVGPLFYRKDAALGLVIGLRVAEKHANARGIAHGGLLLTLADIAQLRTRATVDRACRQVEQKIDRARAVAIEQAREQLCEPWSDARQARERGKERIEQRRAHRSGLQVSESEPERANTALARTMRSPSTIR